MTRLATFLSLVIVAVCTGPLHAHPVPKSSHDRAVVVELLPDPQQAKVKVVVKYRLEVDETTVILEDMAPFRDEVNYTSFKGKPLDYYAEFTRIYAPILADHVDVRIGDREFNLRCVGRSQTLVDEKGQGLGHLRCDFVFECEIPAPANQEVVLRFRDGSYDPDEGKLDLSFAGGQGLKLVSVDAPSAALKAKPEMERADGEDAKLRGLRVVFVKPGQDSAAKPPDKVEPTGPEEALPKTPDSNRDRHESGLLGLFHRAGQSAWLLLFIAFWFGAAHALTPGHGKTLVAAYLVGQNGTVAHALVLGLVTTFTHTSVVFLLAIMLKLLPEGVRPQIQTGLELSMGLLILCLGFYLLLQRLAGGADHIHIGGNSDHHHHHHGGHHHHHHHPQPVGNVSIWGLVTLGISGGLVPCWDAVAMLMLAVGMNMLDLAIPLLLAFSAGLAGTLVLIGILVVKVRRFAGSHLGEGWLIRALPIVSAVFICAVGFWLCYASVNGG